MTDYLPPPLEPGAAPPSEPEETREAKGGLFGAVVKAISKATPESVKQKLRIGDIRSKAGELSDAIKLLQKRQNSLYRDIYQKISPDKPFNPQALEETLRSQGQERVEIEKKIAVLQESLPKIKDTHQAINIRDQLNSAKLQLSEIQKQQSVLQELLASAPFQQIAKLRQETLEKCIKSTTSKDPPEVQFRELQELIDETNQALDGIRDLTGHALPFVSKRMALDIVDYLRGALESCQQANEKKEKPSLLSRIFSRSEEKSYEFDLQETLEEQITKAKAGLVSLRAKYHIPQAQAGTEQLQTQVAAYLRKLQMTGHQDPSALFHPSEIGSTLRHFNVAMAASRASDKAQLLLSMSADIQKRLNEVAAGSKKGGFNNLGEEIETYKEAVNVLEAELQKQKDAIEKRSVSQTQAEARGFISLWEEQIDHLRGKLHRLELLNSDDEHGYQALINLEKGLIQKLKQAADDPLSAAQLVDQTLSQAGSRLTDIASKLKSSEPAEIQDFLTSRTGLSETLEAQAENLLKLSNSEARLQSDLFEGRKSIDSLSASEVKLLKSILSKGFVLDKYFHQKVPTTELHRLLGMFAESRMNRSPLVSDSSFNDLYVAYSKKEGVGERKVLSERCAKIGRSLYDVNQLIAELSQAKSALSSALQAAKLPMSAREPVVIYVEAKGKLQEALQALNSISPADDPIIASVRADLEKVAARLDEKSKSALLAKEDEIGTLTILKDETLPESASYLKESVPIISSLLCKQIALARYGTAEQRPEAAGNVELILKKIESDQKARDAILAAVEAKLPLLYREIAFVHNTIEQVLQKLLDGTLTPQEAVENSRSIASLLSHQLLLLQSGDEQAFSRIESITSYLERHNLLQATFIEMGHYASSLFADIYLQTIITRHSEKFTLALGVIMTLPKVSPDEIKSAYRELLNLVDDAKQLVPDWAKSFVTMDRILKANGRENILTQLQESARQARLDLSQVTRESTIEEMKTAIRTGLKQAQKNMSELLAQNDVISRERSASLPKLVRKPTLIGKPTLGSETDERVIHFQGAKEAHAQAESALRALKARAPSEVGTFESEVSMLEAQMNHLSKSDFMLLTSSKEELRDKLLKIKESHSKLDPDEMSGDKIGIILRAEMARALYLPLGRDKNQAFANAQHILRLLAAEENSSIRQAAEAATTQAGSLNAQFAAQAGDFVLGAEIKAAFETALRQLTKDKERAPYHFSGLAKELALMQDALRKKPESPVLQSLLEEMKASFEECKQKQNPFRLTSGEEKVREALLNPPNDDIQAVFERYDTPEGVHTARLLISKEMLRYIHAPLEERAHLAPDLDSLIGKLSSSSRLKDAISSHTTGPREDAEAFQEILGEYYAITLDPRRKGVIDALTSKAESLIAARDVEKFKGCKREIETSFGNLPRDNDWQNIYFINAKNRLAGKLNDAESNIPRLLGSEALAKPEFAEQARQVMRLSDELKALNSKYEQAPAVSDDDAMRMDALLDEIKTKIESLQRAIQTHPDFKNAKLDPSHFGVSDSASVEIMQKSEWYAAAKRRAEEKIAASASLLAECRDPRVAVEILNAAASHVGALLPKSMPTDAVIGTLIPIDFNNEKLLLLHITHMMLSMAGDYYVDAPGPELSEYLGKLGELNPQVGGLFKKVYQDFMVRPKNKSESTLTKEAAGRFAEIYHTFSTKLYELQGLETMLQGLPATSEQRADLRAHSIAAREKGAILLKRMLDFEAADVEIDVEISGEKPISEMNLHELDLFEKKLMQTADKRTGPSSEQLKQLGVRRQELFLQLAAAKKSTKELTQGIDVSDFQALTAHLMEIVKVLHAIEQVTPVGKPLELNGVEYFKARKEMTDLKQALRLIKDSFKGPLQSVLILCLQGLLQNTSAAHFEDREKLLQIYDHVLAATAELNRTIG